MSIAQHTAELSPAVGPHCPHCGMELPLEATFCASCGTRLGETSDALLQNDKDIAPRYRVTSQVRRRPYTNLLFALDTSHRRPVAIRDIDLTTLNRDIAQSHMDEKARTEATRCVQEEYDFLRLQHIPHVMSLIDLRRFSNHLYTVASWPSNEKKRDMRDIRNTHLYTLQDVLQSGRGLPDLLIVLTWIEQFCTALNALHSHSIVIGDLDPQALIMNGNDYDAQIALMISWLPLPIRNVLPAESVVARATNFTAPEILSGKPQVQSDIYSLGAILYLLLTGVPPAEPTQRTKRRLRSPGDIQSGIPKPLDEFVMRALALDPSQRFENASEMALALTEVRAGRPLPPAGAQFIAPSQHMASQPLPSQSIVAETETSNKKRTKRLPVERPTIDSISPAIDQQLPVQAQFIALAESVVPSQPVSALPEPDTTATQPANNKQTKRLPAQAQQTAPDPVGAQFIAPSEPVAPPDSIAPFQPAAPSEPVIEPATPSAPVAPSEPPDRNATIDEIAEIDTIRIPSITEYPIVPVDEIKTVILPQPSHKDAALFREQLERPSQENGSASLNDDDRQRKEKSLSKRLTKHVTGNLSAISGLSTLPASKPVPPDENGTSVQEQAPAESARQQGNESFLKQLERMVLGKQKHTTTAAALIETPLRVQPNQSYAIRINLTGRNAPTTSADTKKSVRAGGLSGLVGGEVAHIEVRSALYQSYAYIVQQADVKLPGVGYAAEVTIPMQPISSGPSGRRDRLHIFFMDEHRQPLYEKPFVIELFVSHLVQPGREGHNVLTIPL